MQRAKNSSATSCRRSSGLLLAPARVQQRQQHSHADHPEVQGAPDAVGQRELGPVALLAVHVQLLAG